MLKIPFTQTEIDIKSFIKKKTPKIDDHFGVYFICGPQGTGKTYHAVHFATRVDPKKVKIKTNIHSLKLPHQDFTKITDITGDTEEHCLYIIDEISKKYPKESKTDQSFYSWLQQSRKRRRIVILITQEWREVPMWLRRPAKVMIETKPTKFLSLLGFYSSNWGDAINMKFDKDEGEYICPPIKKIIHKRNLSIANLYDTFEPITDL